MSDTRTARVVRIDPHVFRQTSSKVPTKDSVTSGKQVKALTANPPAAIMDHKATVVALTSTANELAQVWNIDRSSKAKSTVHCDRAEWLQSNTCSPNSHGKHLLINHPNLEAIPPSVPTGSNVLHQSSIPQTPGALHTDSASKPLRHASDFKAAKKKRNLSLPSIAMFMGKPVHRQSIRAKRAPCSHVRGNTADRNKAQPNGKQHQEYSSFFHRRPTRFTREFG